MVVLPTAIALQFKKGYKTTLIISVIESVVAMVGGLTISYYADWASGATIVLVTVALLIFAFIYRFIKKKFL
jgi:zinc transport system permease protein